MAEKEINDVINGLSVYETAKILKVDKQTVRQLITNGKLHKAGKRGRHVFIKKTDVLEYAQRRAIRAKLKNPYGAISLDFDEALKPLDSLHNPNGIFDPMQFCSDVQYAVTNKGRVFNLTTSREQARFSEGEDGRLMTSITVGREHKPMKVHRLIAYAWCPNSKHKDIVHHIDGDPVNNNCTNLLWVTRDQHAEAHRLMRAAADSGDHVPYGEYIDKIKRENAFSCEYRRVNYKNNQGNIVSLMFAKDALKRFEDHDTAKDADESDVTAATYVFYPYTSRSNNVTMKLKEL